MSRRRQRCADACIVAIQDKAEDSVFAWQRRTIGACHAWHELEYVLSVPTQKPSKRLTGNTGKGLATIAITVIGIGALLGKVSWGMAIIVGIGVDIVFGAAGIVDAMDVEGGTITGCAVVADDQSARDSA